MTVTMSVTDKKIRYKYGPWEILVKQFVGSYSKQSWKHLVTSILDVSTGTADDLHSVCLIIIAVPIISAYLESGVEMIPYMTRHNASCIITKVCVIFDLTCHNMMRVVKFLVKVRIFWEGHKIWKKKFYLKFDATQ